MGKVYLSFFPFEAALEDETSLSSLKLFLPRIPHRQLIKSPPNYLL